MSFKRPLILSLLSGAIALPCALAEQPSSPAKEHPMESAKRRAPSAEPVEHNGIRYEQMRRAKEHGFNQSGGILVAINIATAEPLWTLQLYQTQFDGDEEQDAQEVYLSELSINRQTEELRATDERKRVYLIPLREPKVIPQ